MAYSSGSTPIQRADWLSSAHFLFCWSDIVDLFGWSSPGEAAVDLFGQGRHKGQKGLDGCLHELLFTLIHDCVPTSAFGFSSHSAPEVDVPTRRLKYGRFKFRPVFLNEDAQRAERTRRQGGRANDLPVPGAASPLTANAQLPKELLNSIRDGPSTDVRA